MLSKAFQIIVLVAIYVTNAAVQADTVVYYNFDGNVSDSSSNGENGTLVGTGTNYVAGFSGQALNFDGNGYLAMPDDLLRNNPDFTVSLMFKTTAVGTSGGIFGYQNQDITASSSGQYMPIISINSQGKLFTSLWIGHTMSITSTATVNDGQWHRVALTSNTTTGDLFVYLDGVSIGSANGNIQHLQMSYNQLGVNDGSTRVNYWLDNDKTDYFVGSIDEFVMESTAKTAVEISKTSQSIVFSSISTQTTSGLLLTATATSGLPVSYVSNTISVCTVSGSTVSKVSVGSCSLTASQIGDASYSSAQDVTNTFTMTDAANNSPTGSVIISGTATQYQTLNASNTLADTDGMGSISYQWQRDGSNIVGETNASYTLVQADVGAVIAVIASYTDGLGTNESVSSSATSVVANVNDAPSGSVNISGNTIQRQVLSASNSLSDVDGLSTINYQWQRNGSSIVGETNTSYTLVQADVGATITVIASYTDGSGTNESVSSSASTTIANINDTPSGSVTVSGTTTQGQTLAVANSLSDLDGMGSISYQWQRDGSNIVGETNTSYTLVQADVGAVVVVIASYTDGFSTNESVSSSASAAIANINDTPSGSVTVSGSATQGQTLAVSNSLSDSDGMGSISHQWQRDGSNIGGATSASYTLVQADVGTTITVVARYTDGSGTNESVSSSASAAIANINDTPSGSVTVSGAATQGQTLTVSNSLSDPDGIGSISYQWQRDGSTINGATSASYTLVQADVGASITVVARYTDGSSTNESVSSSASATIVNVNDTPSGSVTVSGTVTQGQTLSASNSLSDLDGIGSISYQWQRDGSTINGATSANYTLVQADVGATITVVARYTDGSGTSESVSSSASTSIANVNDTPSGSVTVTGTVTQGQTLAASNNLSDPDGIGSISYQWQRDGSNIGSATSANYTLVQSDVGASITVVARYTDGSGTNESVSSSASAGIANVNDTPSGSVTVSGAATQGQTLSASNSLSDPDGIGSISYQWQRDGSTINGATSASYTLVQADVGATITVVARYTDGSGTSESVSSSASTSIANVNDTPSGSVTVTGTATQGQTLAVSNSLSDGDGIGSISYQWQRDGSTINGETNTSYTLVQADVGAKITVIASYTDAMSSNELVASNASAIVANINDSPSGKVSISGTAIQGQTLAASNTLADVDGLGDISYQWQRNGNNIEGATDSTYTLVQADVGNSLSVIASYTDGHTTGESIASSSTSSVSNLNDTPSGSVSISGTALSGQTLTASNTLTDPDGIGEINYQWYRNGVIISAATAASYQLTDADVGQSISVVASYTDSDGHSESVSHTLVGVIDGDMDGDGTGDSVDADIDGDGMSNTYEEANGLNSLDASDRDTDTDDDGVSNFDESVAGTAANVNENIPTLELPEDVTVNSTGLYTEVEIGNASALDSSNNSIESTVVEVDGVASSQIPSQFRPGQHLVTWKASDAEGNAITAIQKVNVIPLVNFSKDQRSSEGTTVDVKVILNGPPVSYPVSVPYRLSGTTTHDGSDHDLLEGTIMIESPSLESTLSVTFEDDGPGEGSEVLMLSIDSPTNAVPGSHETHSIEVLEGNVPPVVVLSADQGSGNTRIISQSAGVVSITAQVADINPEDTHEFDWSATDNALIDSDNQASTFTLDPSNLSPGVYRVQVLVSDGSEIVSSNVKLKVVSLIPVLGSDDTDSDGDGTLDSVEGYQDSDNDGIPNYLDNSQLARNVIQERVSSDSEFLMETEPGLLLSLGPVAFEASHGASQVSEDEIQTLVNDGAGTVADSDHEYNSGIFDFTIEELPVAGQNVSVVIAQFAEIPENAIYRKLTPTGWGTFVEDSQNLLASAEGRQGYCPSPKSNFYSPGLTAGHWCVLLTIEDGGPNDADGLVNQSVDDPGGIATRSDDSPEPAPPTGSAEAEDNSVSAGVVGVGGCTLNAVESRSIDPTLPLLLMFSLLYLAQRNQRLCRRKKASSL